jgi:16S rRNA (cytosine1402-N4)-methyltransferase
MAIQALSSPRFHNEEPVGTAKENPVFQHKPVLTADVVSLLTTGWDNTEKPEFRIIDCTLGGGGHAEALVRGLYQLHPDCLLTIVGLDQDGSAREAAGKRLAALRDSFPNFQFSIVATNFRNLSTVMNSQQSDRPADIILADIGVSSHQIDTPERGFSVNSTHPLDMRMSPQLAVSASDLLLNAEEHELARIFFEYAEEPRSRKLARAIAEDRSKLQLDVSNASNFARFCNRVLGYRGSRSEPAIRIFQALRIAVNDELGALQDLLEAIPKCINLQRGRVGIISFHSLEDRMVKKAYRLWEESCYNSRSTDSSIGAEYPRGGVTANPEETDENPRSRSARLRVFYFGESRRSLRARFR